MFLTFQSILPIATLISHIIFILVIFSLIFRKSWGNGIARWVGENAILLAFLVSLGAIMGSLFYSEFVGYEPCKLCWWQRTFIYPQAILFGVALWKKKTDVFLYAVPLLILSALIALYHEYIYMGGTSILPCTALGGACAKIYVLEFGYITIPMMSLTVALSLLLLAFAHKVYQSR